MHLKTDCTKIKSIKSFYFYQYRRFILDHHMQNTKNETNYYFNIYQIKKFIFNKIINYINPL